MASMGAQGGSVSGTALLWVFAHLLAVYNLHGLMTFKQGQLYDLSLRAYYRSTLHRNILGGSLMLSFLLILLSPSWLWLPLLSLNLLALLYGSPLLKIRGDRFRPKDLPLLKTPLVTLGVSTSVILLPQAWSQNEDDLNLQADHLAILFHIFINVLSGDLRDLKLDRTSDLKTWPTQWGFARTRLLGILLGISFAILSFILEADEALVALLVLDVALFSGLRPDLSKTHYHFLDFPHFLPAIVIAATAPIKWIL
jgi:4-hydroxybenzoate polyprenyltransferase